MNKELLLTEAEKLEILGYDTEKMVTALGDVRRLLEAQHAKTSGHYEKKLAELEIHLRSISTPPSPLETQLRIDKAISQARAEERAKTLLWMGQWISEHRGQTLHGGLASYVFYEADIRNLKSGTMPTSEVRE